MTAPLVSVIILSHNRRDEMREALLSVTAQDYAQVEIVVLDNGSTDGSAEMITSEFPDVRLIALSENIGACAGRNRAFEETSGKYIFQMDNDATVGPDGAIASMVSRMEEEDDLGIIFTRIEDPSTRRAYRPGYGGRHVDDEFYTWRFHGCAAMIRREAIDQAGYYLPEEFFRAAEENDLAVRVIDAGFNILYMPSVTAYHTLSPKARDGGEIVYLTVRNNLRVAWKFFPVTRALLLTAWRPLHFLATRLAQGDFAALGRFVKILAGQADAIRRRHPVSRKSVRLIDTLTIEPAMTLAVMRALRSRPVEVSFSELVKRRFQGGRR